MKQIGSSIEGANARTAPVFDPATGEQTAEVVLATVASTTSAVCSPVAGSKTGAVRAAAPSMDDPICFTG